MHMHMNDVLAFSHQDEIKQTLENIEKSKTSILEHPSHPLLCNNTPINR